MEICSRVSGVSQDNRGHTEHLMGLIWEIASDVTSEDQERVICGHRSACWLSQSAWHNEADVCQTPPEAADILKNLPEATASYPGQRQ